MSETLSTPSRETSPGSRVPVDPELVREIDSIETNDERTLSPAGERLQAATNRVRSWLERRALKKAHKEAIKEDTRRSREAQDAAFASYEDNINYTETKEKLIDPRSRLRKIGDGGLKFMEKRGGGKTAKLLESWGIIPVIGTRHKQRGLNFSAWVARKYVKAQEARKNRESRIAAGFLSPEAQAQLNEMWEPEEQPTPEKLAQDAAYETYQENLDATAARERAEKEAQDSAYETYEENIDTTAKREAQEDAFKSYEENIDATAKRESQEAAFDTYQDNIDATAAREQAERDAQRTAYDSYADNIDTTAKRELQEATYETYAGNIDATARREAQDAAFASYEDNINTTAQREAYESYQDNIDATAEREAAHARAEAARERREHRRERIREHATNLKERANQLRGRIGASAMKLLRGAKSLAGKLRRRR